MDISFRNEDKEYTLSIMPSGRICIISPDKKFLALDNDENDVLFFYIYSAIECYFEENYGKSKEN